MTATKTEGKTVGGRTRDKINDSQFPYEMVLLQSKWQEQKHKLTEMMEQETSDWEWKTITK